ncbi:MAG: hypothetical protein K9L25_14095 [Methylovulum sp.]|nr:hypothetical protein [Methylovulum sp.]
MNFLYLPPYSPDLNPIENALNTITCNDEIGYFNHAAEF